MLHCSHRNKNQCETTAVHIHMTVMYHRRGHIMQWFSPISFCTLFSPCIRRLFTLNVLIENTRCKCNVNYLLVSYLPLQATSFQEREFRISNKSVFSFLRQLTTWHCPHSAIIHSCCGAAAANRRPCSSRYLLPAGPTAANPPRRRAAPDGADKQIDGWTERRIPDSYLDPNVEIAELNPNQTCMIAVTTLS